MLCVADLLPHSGRWFRASTSFRLETMGIRVLKAPRPTRHQPRTQSARNATIVNRRVTSPIHGPTHVHILIWHRKLLQHHRQLVMEALLQPKLSKTMLEGGWIKWLWRKLRTPNHDAWYISHQFHSVLTISCILFFFVPENLETRFLLRGVVLSRPKLPNFGMWQKFTKF
jgi:hypothetical protein